MSSLGYVEFQHSLKTLSTTTEVRQLILDKLKDIPQLQTLKFCPELLLFICNLIENAVQDRKIKKIDKKEFVISIVSEIFSLSEEEKPIYDNMIEFLHNNKKIKKVDLLKITCYSVWGWMKRRVL